MPVDECPMYAAFFSQAGITFAATLSGKNSDIFKLIALILLAFGAAYGTLKSGISISSISTSKPDSIIKSLLPVIMAGILSIYGMVVGIFIALQLSPTEPLTLFAGSLHLGAGLAVGIACLSSGLAIGVIGEQGIRGYAKQPRFFFGLVLLLVFAEVLGIYGFIAAGMLVNITRSYLTC